MNGWTLRCGLIGAGLIAALESSAMAQNDAVYAQADKEVREKRAKELADEATRQMEQGNIQPACTLFTESVELVPNLQIEAELIECLVKLGIYTDAHRRMLDAAEKAKLIPDEEAVIWATKRAQEIKEEAPCIVVNVSEELRGIPDLEVSLDGATIPRASWNDLCVPVNLGTHQTQARAARRTWNPQRTSALHPRRRYVVALMPPFIVEPEPPPQKMVSPVKPSTFVVPSVAFLVIGLIPLSLVIMEPNKTTRERELLAASFIGAGVGGLTSGITVYAMTPDMPQYSVPKPHAMNVGLVYRGRF